MSGRTSSILILIFFVFIMFSLMIISQNKKQRGSNGGMDYNLMPNEVVLKQETGVAYGNGLYSGELLITNLNVIFIDKGVYGKTKKALYFPINQIKKYNGKPNVFCGKSRNGVSYTLNISMLNSTESFAFQYAGKRKVSECIAQITGDSNVVDSEIVDENDDTLVGVFKEVGKELNSVIGIPTKKSKKATGENKSKTKVSTHCKCCSAVISGFEGEIVRCEYCDSEQVL